MTSCIKSPILKVLEPNKVGEIPDLKYGVNPKVFFPTIFSHESIIIVNG